MFIVYRKEVAPGIQSEERKDVAPHGQYIPYYTPNPPAGSSSSDYKAYVGSTSGNVSLEFIVYRSRGRNLFIFICQLFIFHIAAIWGILFNRSLKPTK